MQTTPRFWRIAGWMAPWALVGCALLPVTGDAALPSPDLPVPGPGVRERLNSEGKVSVREEYLVDEKGRIWRHGGEWTFWPNGATKSERHFDHGEPCGEWKTFWSDGEVRSEYAIDPFQLTPMVYWYPSGQKASEGMALSGRREGLWTYWYASGRVRSTGTYVGGEKHGPWEEYHPDGTRSSAGDYSFGAKVGSWSYFSLGESPAASSD